MNSVARIAFFIILSFALHLLSLPFDFMLTAESFQPELVGVSYVSRSLDSFYPVSEAKKSISREVESPTQSVKKTIRADAEQAKRIGTEKKRAENIKPVIAKTGMKQKATPLETETIAITKSLSESPINELALSQPEAVVEVMDSPQEVVDPPLMQTVVKIEPPIEEPLSSLGGISTQAETSDANLDRDSTTSGQQNSNHSQGFKNALPRYDVNPPPSYPEVAKRRGWEGKVVFEALILKSGRVGSLDVVASSGYKSLDQTARKAIYRWKFKPATSFGISIDSQVEIPVNFSLKDL